MKLSLNKKAFTLVEMLTVISMISILALLSYVPFSYYSNIAKVRNGASKLNQVINEAKFFAYWWYVNKKWLNSNIWVFLEKWENKWIKIIAYPYNNPAETPFINWEVIREDNLWKDVEISNLSSSWAISLLLFKSIKWDLLIFSKENDSLKEFNEPKIDITIWYKWVKNWNLSKNLSIVK